jgi:hypothetical protein
MPHQDLNTGHFGGAERHRKVPVFLYNPSDPDKQRGALMKLLDLVNGQSPKLTQLDGVEFVLAVTGASRGHHLAHIT